MYVCVCLTLYSALNSVSILLRRRNSQESSNAVKIGSRELKAINELADKALYAFIRDCEWQRESFSFAATHSSQPQLKFYVIFFCIKNI